MEEAERKWTVKAVAAYLGITIEELSGMTGISYTHLKEVSANRVRMTADDLLKLSAVSGIPPQDFKVS